MLGYDSKEELLSRTLADLLPDEGQRRALREQVDNQAVVQGREITLTRKDGRPLVCLNTAGAVRDTSGRVVRYHGALMDITERREMERRLYQQQEFARRLIDSFPDLIFVVDRAGNYTFVSPRVKDILGYETEEMLNAEFGARTHMEDRPALLALFAVPTVLSSTWRPGCGRAFDMAGSIPASVTTAPASGMAFDAGSK